MTGFTERLRENLYAVAAWRVNSIWLVLMNLTMLAQSTKIYTHPDGVYCSPVTRAQFAVPFPKVARPLATCESLARRSIRGRPIALREVQPELMLRSEY